MWERHSIGCRILGLEVLQERLEELFLVMVGDVVWMVNFDLMLVTS